ncbi:hypothetical protein [Rhodovulum euryhalinum]|uniref:Uncharacterized protein n=1 Tax=Rhodovulum euryhalinum TaxID=35805 RepID=A0A4R2KD76_9RHOB|nr:hypothetical protein [Rhodovulum euryhalinum]TCO70252.1 hypothetical protein EV655_11016 [Rhodovulum euryhalinum]
MIYGFETDDENAAIAALIVYVCWRSRDRAKFKITPDVWGQIERFTKDAAKRAQTIQDFIEALKRPGRMNAPTLQPRYLEVGTRGEIPMMTVINEDGSFREAIQFGADRDLGLREFGTRVIERADAHAVIRTAYRNTAWVVLLVRDRLEREKPIEQHLETVIEGETA